MKVIFHTVIHMGKGPNSIYKDCIAKARKDDEWLAEHPEEVDVRHYTNTKFNCISLFERDVRLAFFDQNYSDRATDRAIKQWLSLDVANRIVKDGFKLFLFLDYPTSISKGATS